jgi:peptide/nickel transport system permease protein
VARYLIDRLLQSVIVLALMSFVIYWLMGLMPGDPIDLMISADPKLTTDDAIRLRALYGLDKPITERYLNWLSAAFFGDFGFSRLHAKPVLNVLWPALSNTIVLLGISFILSLIFALPAGIYAAIRQYSFADYAVNLAAFAGISVPSFWLALLLITLFSVILGILPASGTEIIGAGLTGMWDTAKFLILPIATLAISSIGSHTRFVRAAMIETMRQDYIRTARAKGANETRVVLKHAFRNAMIPVATIIALDFGFLFSGALIVETIFAYPGMGKLIFDAIMGNDFNLAMIAFLFATILTLLGNLIADLAYGWLDPRITTGTNDGGGSK